MPRDHQAGDQDLAANADQERLGRRIREAREYLGLSQEAVADSLGLSRAAVSALENGKRKVSSLELKQLAGLLKQPVTFFLEEEPVVSAAKEDATLRALFRTTRELSDTDREQVLRFARFLRQAGRAPAPDDDLPHE